MQCPKCMRSEFVQPNGLSHYVCVTNDDGTAGCGAQFTVVEDDRVRFPYNMIFPLRGRQNFVRKPYLQINAIE